MGTVIDFHVPHHVPGLSAWGGLYTNNSALNGDSVLQNVALSTGVAASVHASTTEYVISVLDRTQSLGPSSGSSSSGSIALIPPAAAEVIRTISGSSSASVASSSSLPSSIPPSALHSQVSTTSTTSLPPTPPTGGLSLSDLLRTMHQGTPGWFQGINIFEQFGPMLPTLWYLWELVFTGEPILVVGKTPALCSRAVLGLASLISPMEFGGDYRPYFTIYDSDFRYYSSLQDLGPNSLPACIIGVTNPLFLKVFERFPHVLVLHSPSSGPVDASLQASDAGDDHGDGSADDETMPRAGASTPSAAGGGALSRPAVSSQAAKTVSSSTPSSKKLLSPRIVKKSAADAMSSLASSSASKHGPTLFSKVH